MNEVNEKIEIKEIVKSCRSFNLVEILNVIIRSGLTRAGSWGFRSPFIMVKNYAFRFTVSGMHHKGHVYIVLNGLDLFDIYYTSNQGTIKKISKDVYIEDFIETLDVNIERIAEYYR